MPPASWAKRTGFKGRVSGESISGDSGQLLLSRPAKTPEVVPDLEAGRPRPTPPPASAPAPVNGGDKAKNERTAAAPTPVGDQPPKRRKNSDGGEGKGLGVNGNGTRKPDPPPPKSRREEDPVSLAQVPEEDDFVGRRPHINYDLRDSPGLGDCSSLPRPSNQCRCRCRIIGARFICYGLIDFFFFVLGSTYPSVWVSALSVHDGIDRPHSSGHRPRHGRYLREQRAIPVFFFWNFLLEHSKLVHLIFSIFRMIRLRWCLRCSSSRGWRRCWILCSVRGYLWFRARRSFILLPRWRLSILPSFWHWQQMYSPLHSLFVRRFFLLYDLLDSIHIRFSTTFRLVQHLISRRHNLVVLFWASWVR